MSVPISGRKARRNAVRDNATRKEKVVDTPGVGDMADFWNHRHDAHSALLRLAQSARGELSLIFFCGCASR